MFLNSLDDAKKRPTEDAKTIQRGMRAEFDQIVDAFKVGGLLAFKGAPFMTMPSVVHRDNVNQFTRAAEQWTLAHEVSHHLARDLSTRRDKGVEALMAGFKSRSAIGPQLAELSAAQRCEVEADLLATLIVAGHFLPGGGRSAALRSAIGGAAIALITVGHLRNEWTSSPDATHPGCMDRLRLVLTFVCEIYGTQRLHPEDSPQSHITLSRFAAPLMVYANWAHDIEQAELLGEAVQRALPDAYPASPQLLVVHYAAAFGMAAENYAEAR
jgi:hypothetical protein